MSFIRKLIAKIHEKKVAKYLSVYEKEDLFKAGYSLKQLHLTEEEYAQFVKDGLLVDTMALKPKKRKARHDHCITLND